MLHEMTKRLTMDLAFRWCAAENGGVTVGDEVDFSVAVGGEVALLNRGGIWLNAMAWRAEDVPERLEAIT